MMWLSSVGSCVRVKCTELCCESDAGLSFMQCSSQQSKLINIQRITFAFQKYSISSCSESNSGSESSSSSSQSAPENAKQSTTNNVSKNSKSDTVTSSHDGSDDETRTGAITSNNNTASQYHNDNGTEDSDPDDSDAISKHSDNHEFSSSKSSIDVSLWRESFIYAD